MVGNPPFQHQNLSFPPVTRRAGTGAEPVQWQVHGIWAYHVIFHGLLNINYRYNYGK